MFQFILLDILFVAVGTLVYIFVRALPRVEEEPVGEDTRGVIERWIASELPERFDAFLNTVLFKTLRKAKVWVMKIDNSVTKHLATLKPENGAEQKPDFKEITGGGDVAKTAEAGDTTK